MKLYTISSFCFRVLGGQSAVSAGRPENLKIRSVKLSTLIPGGVNLKIYPGKSENCLCFLYALVCPYIFLLFDCFEWALIDCIEKHRVHSVLWQFQMGG